ncbi:MAG TPA: GNAT family N-acetyltransferase [Chromatiales bacterium]|nr:GNAT family N-acetyltransferase [Chromatiales bacterium]
MTETHPALPLDDKLVELRFKLNVGEVNLYTFRLDGKYTSQNIFALKPLNVPDDIFTAHPQLDTPVQYNSLPIEKACNKIQSNDKLITYFTNSYLHYFVDTSATLDEYLGSFRSKTRNSLKRKIKKAHKGEGSGVKVVTKKEELRDFLKDAWIISEKTYQERLLDFPLPRDEDFIRECEEAMARNELVGILLYVEGVPAAYNLCPVYGDGILLYEYTGYDPAYAKFSAGTVVQYETIKYAFEDPRIKFYDLCTGEGPHKELFATGSTLCCDVFIFPKKPKYQFMVWSKSLTDNITNILRATLKKIGIKDLIKRAIRRRA